MSGAGCALGSSASRGAVPTSIQVTLNITENSHVIARTLGVRAMTPPRIRTEVFVHTLG